MSRLQSLHKSEFFRTTGVVSLAALMYRKAVFPVERTCLLIRRVVNAVAQSHNGDLGNVHRLRSFFNFLEQPQANPSPVVALANTNPADIESALGHIERDKSQYIARSNGHEDILVKNIGRDGDLARMLIKPFRKILRNTHNPRTVSLCSFTNRDRGVVAVHRMADYSVFPRLSTSEG